MNLGGKERFEDLSCFVVAKPDTGIADGDSNLVFSISLRADDELALALHALHRLDPIEHQVHQHLLQLQVISTHPGKVFLQHSPDGYSVLGCFAVEKDDHFSNDFVEVNQLAERRSLFE